MVTVYGMNDKVGNISFYDAKRSEYNFAKPYSEATAKTIDEEVRRIIAQAYKRAKELLIKKKKELEVVAKELLKKEIIFQTDLKKLIGKRPFHKETAYEAFIKGTSTKKESKKAETKTKKPKGIATNTTKKPTSGFSVTYNTMLLNDGNVMTVTLFHHHRHCCIEFLCMAKRRDHAEVALVPLSYTAL